MAFDISKFKQNTNTAKAAENLQKKAAASGGEGGTWQSVLDVSKVPYPVKWWRPTAGTHYIDIVGSQVTNPRNPAVMNGSIGMGDYDFGLQIWTHPDPKGGGPKGLPHVCLKRNNYAAKCPRCEEFFSTYQKGVKGSGNTIHRSSERTFLIIVPRENKSTPGTEAFFWETNVHSFTGELLEEANALSDGGEPSFFWWPTDHGRTVEFTAVAGDLENSFDFKRFKFHPRPEAVGTAQYEKWSFPLDSIVRIPTFQQMEDEIYGREDEEGVQDTQEQASQDRRDNYRREVDSAQEAPSTSPQDTGTVEDGKWASKPEASAAPKGTEKPKASGSKVCPEGFTYGVTSVEENRRECRKCEIFDRCVDNK